MLNQIKLESVDAKCKNCGNNLRYSPEVHKLKCEKCGSTKEIEATYLNEKKPYDNLDDSELNDWQKLEKVIKCKSCGSTIELKNNEISINCPYCDSQNIVLQDEIKGLYPDNIVLFKFGKEVASQKFKEQVKKKFMAPRAFKKQIPENSIDGFYFPSFGFDADSHSSYKGRLYEHYTTTVNGKTTTHTRYFSIKGEVDCAHRDVVVESSSRLTQYELKNMLPYDFKLKSDFKPEYLFGYKVEQYNERFSVSATKGKELCDEQIRTKILSKYRYDGVDYLNVDSTYKNKKFAYYMLPVYTFSFMFKNKNYTAFMNGQTGKLGSGLPISKLKVALGIIGFILLIIMIVLLAGVAGD